MNRTRISLTAALLSLCLLLSGCMMPPAEGTVTSFSLEDIPAWSGEPYVAVDGNQPDFPEEDMTSVSFETYSELDTLGRCGVGPGEHQFRHTLRLDQPGVRRGVPVQPLSPDRLSAHRRERQRGKSHHRHPLYECGRDAAL